MGPVCSKQGCYSLNLPDLVALALGALSNGAMPAPQSGGAKAEEPEAPSTAVGAGSNLEESFAVLEGLLDKLGSLDQDRWFALPVEPDSAPNYLEVIARPMDFKTMRDKVRSSVLLPGSIWPHLWLWILPSCWVRVICKCASSKETLNTMERLDSLSICI